MEPGNVFSTPCRLANKEFCLMEIMAVVIRSKTGRSIIIFPNRIIVKITTLIRLIRVFWNRESLVVATTGFVRQIQMKLFPALVLTTGAEIVVTFLILASPALVYTREFVANQRKAYLHANVRMIFREICAKKRLAKLTHVEPGGALKLVTDLHVIARMLTSRHLEKIVKSQFVQEK